MVIRRAPTLAVVDTDKLRWDNLFQMRRSAVVVDIGLFVTVVVVVVKRGSGCRQKGAPIAKQRREAAKASTQEDTSMVPWPLCFGEVGGMSPLG